MSLKVTRTVTTTKQVPLEGNEKYLVLFALRAARETVEAFIADNVRCNPDSEPYLFYSADTLTKLEALEAEAYAWYSEE